MAAPAFAKFSFGAGLVSPQPLAGSVPEAGGVPVELGGGAPAPAATSVEAVVKEAKVPMELIQSILTYIKADADTLPEHLACVPDEDFGEATEKAEYKGGPLTSLRKGQVLYFVNVLRRSVASPPAVPVAPPPVPLASPQEGEKHKISEVLDQIDDTPFLQLPADSVAKMREFHRNVTGGDPPDHERPSAEQLSALAHRINSGKAPFADFAVFGPHGRRQTKLLRFTAQVFVHGELVTRQLRGPGSFQGWRASWGVYRAAMIMINGASPATLDRYARGIEELVTLYPQAWGIISLADETMRAERWEILKEGLGETASWEDVISGSAFGFGNTCAHWWFVHVLGPLASGSRQGATATVATLEGLVPGSHLAPMGHQPTFSAESRGGSPGPRKKSRGQGGGGRSKSACKAFNATTCTFGAGCKFPHVCSGCGGRFPITKCWTCRPSKGGSKGGGNSGPSNDGAPASKKKRKGSRGGGGAPSAK